MSRVWLCEGITAEHPLFLEEKGVNLYSFEELCYYLYQNTGEIGDSFFNENLFQWLAKEAGQKELSVQIRDGIAQEKSGCWCLEQILKSAGFYNQAEIQTALAAAAWMDYKNPLERQKLRGDRLLKEEKYRAAMLEYRKVLKQTEQEYGNSEILCLVWHNMGTAYARQMLFGQAAECYEKAYEIGQRKESKDAYLLALACKDGQMPKTESEKIVELRQQLTEKKQSDRTGYEKLLEDTLQMLRTEYRKSE